MDAATANQLIRGLKAAERQHRPRGFGTDRRGRGKRPRPLRPADEGGLRELQELVWSADEAPDPATAMVVDAIWLWREYRTAEAAYQKAMEGCGPKTLRERRAQLYKARRALYRHFNRLEPGLLIGISPEIVREE